ncbi:MAG: hypothetical protein R3C59_19630 [Planctomycetaceae bacterium]
MRRVAVCLLTFPFWFSEASAQQTVTAGAISSESVADPSADRSTAAKAASEAASEADEPLQEYIRIRRNDSNVAETLETSVIRLEKSARYPGTTVDLIGAIHLGEAEYYRDLNKLFRQYDVLLFEAVMPAAAVKQGLRPGGGKGSRRVIDEQAEWNDANIGLAAISVLQLAAKDSLGLSFQLSDIDYTPRNFVHADMTKEELESTMALRGESFAETMAREMGKEALEQQKSSPVAQQLDFVLSLLASDRLYRVRRIFAVQLTKANLGTAFAEKDGRSTIITERNIKALQVLTQQLKKGKTKIGIFYGAGHFPDMEKRLVTDFGYERQSEQWLTAWRLAPATK